MRIIFHVGLPKTGSSYLQAFCFSKRNQLSEKGINFPNIGKHSRSDITLAGNAKDISKLLKIKNYKSIVEYLEKACEEAKTNNCNTILLSHEGLNSQLPDLFNNELFLNWVRLNKIDVDVLMFVRNPYDLLLSLYKQKCRTGKRLSTDQFLRETKNLDFIIILLNEPSFKSKFNLHIVNYDKHKKNLITIFLKHIFDISQTSLENFNSDFVYKKINRSLTLKEIQFLQKVSPISHWLSKKISKLFKRRFNYKESKPLIEKFKEDTKLYYGDKILELVEQLNLFLPLSEKLSLNDE